MSVLKLDFDKVDTATTPNISVIWMHGLGDHGSSFIPIVPYLGLDDCPPVRFIFPHAPERPIAVNMGYEMRAWFDIYGSFEAGDAEDAEGIEESKELITKLIQMEKDRGVPTERIILAGFSQGCAMALHTGLTSPEKLGGVIGLSGYIPMIQSFPDARSEANQKTPVFLAHGIEDEVVPFGRGESSFKVLKELDYDVEWHPYPMMPHTLTMDELQDISKWLHQVIANFK